MGTSYASLMFIFKECFATGVRHRFRAGGHRQETQLTKLLIT